MRNIGLMVAMVVMCAVMGFAAPSDDVGVFTRTVTGTEIGHYLNGPLPTDLSTVTVGAYVFFPGKSRYAFLPGTGTSSGTFTIKNVPVGSYLLQLGNQYLWTGNSMVDADYIAAYRSDTVAADWPNTFFTFDVTNLNSWQVTDFFEIACTQGNVFEFFFGAIGETTFTGTYNDFTNLVNGAEGDQCNLAQLSTQFLGGVPFAALSRYLALPTFTQAQDSNTAINGNLATIAQTNTFEVNINGADLQAQALAANPNATMYLADFFLDVNPGSLAHGQTTSTPDLVLYQWFPQGYGGSLINTNVDLGALGYGNPYPAAQWPVFLGYTYQAANFYTAPGATNSALWTTLVFGETTNLPSTTSPIAPLVGVAQKPLVNGSNFFVNQTGIGLTPTLQWSAPTLGSAGSYGVHVLQLSNVGGNTVMNRIASFATSATSLQIPPNVLTPGQAYVFQIRARYIPGVSFAKTPFEFGPIVGTADVISGMMLP